MSHAEEQSSIDFHTRVLLVDTFESFVFLINQQRKYTFDKSGLNQYFYVIIPSYDYNHLILIERIFQYCLQNNIIHINVLYEMLSMNYIATYTYFPFDESNCRNTKPILYNIYQNGKLKWNKPSFPRKISNFWQCPLKVLIWDETPFLNLNGNKLVGGVDGQFLKTLSDFMNFSLETIISPGGRGGVHLNGTSYGAFKMIEDGVGELMLGGTMCAKIRKQHFASTIFYFTTPFSMIVKQPETYSSLEILLFPFDLYTWLIILLLFIGREIVRILLKSTFFASNFTGFSFKFKLLMPWLFGVLILRSSYEGSIYKFLNNRPKRPVPNDFSEAIQSGYKFITEEKYNSFLKDFIELNNKLKLYKVSQSEIFTKFYELDGKFGLLTRGELFVGNKLNATMFGWLSKMKKPIVYNFLCMYMPKHSFITSELNKRIQQMADHGYVERIVKQSLQSGLTWKNHKFNNEARVMTIHHLSGAFELIIGIMGLALCVFVMELLSVQ